MNQHTMTAHAMSCPEFEARLNELLDQRAPLDLDDALREHHDGCRDCRGLLAAYGEVVQAVRFRPPPEPSERLNERIMGAVLAQRRADAAQPAGTRRGPSTVRRDWLWRAGLVASLAILVALAWKFGAPGTNRPPGPAEEIVKRGGDEAPLPGQALSARARDAAQRHLEGLARGTIDDLSDVLTLVPEVDTSPATALWGDDSSSGGQGAKVATNLAQTFRPLANSTKKTLDFLFGSPEGDKGKL